MSLKIRKHSFPDETYQIGIDFDGVIHRCSKGFYDGTIYDEPIEGSFAALKQLSEKYTIIIYSAKAKPDRPLVDGKTGVELIWEWLKKHNMDVFVKEVTSEKPRAVCYIDDKAVRFNNSWENALNDLKRYGYINES